MSKSEKTEGRQLTVGDIVQIGPVGSAPWKVDYIHEDGNLSLSTPKSKRHYVNPSRITYVFDQG